jgi:endonuclease YncB( thermonuclease family)
VLVAAHTTKIVGCLDDADNRMRLVCTLGVEDGWAWNYVKYSKSERLADLERQARAARRGLWAGTSPVAPCVYRAEKARKQREKKLQKAG